MLKWSSRSWTFILLCVVENKTNTGEFKLLCLFVPQCMCVNTPLPRITVPMATRAELLRQAFELYRRETHKSDIREQVHLIPSRIWDAFVRENADHTRLRPDPATNRVVPNAEGFERLARLVERYAPLVRDALRGENLVSLEDLFQAFQLSFKYFTFDRFLLELRTAANMAIQQARDADTVVFLALPSSRTDKSNLWLNAYLWLNTDMPSCVDFIVPSTTSAQRFMLYCQSVSGRTMHARILYVDDMTYSGGQVVNFANIEQPTGNFPLSRLTIIPIIPYVALMARRSFNYATLVSVYVGHAFPAFQWNMTHLVEAPFDVLTSGVYDAPTVRRSHTFIKDVLQVRAPSADEWPDPETYYAVQLYLLLSETTLPCVVFEHKLADSISLPWELFAQERAAPGETAGIPLVTVGQGSTQQPITYKGSVAFYKALKWRYKTTPVKNALALSRLAGAHFACATCHAPPTLQCGSCNLAYYCSNPACPKEHWTSGGHASICGEPLV